ncbi:MAG: hypothetical protein ABI623_02660, partial [bacterium]
ASGAAVAERMARAADTPGNRDVAAHIIGIERWGARRLRTALGDVALADEYESLNNPVKEDYEAALHRTAELLKIGNGALIHPLRLAISGVGSGPGLFDILFVIGKEETNQRIKSAIGKLQNA